MAANPKQTIRWGILGTGWVSTSFVKDLVLSRPSAPVEHLITALGTSSEVKGSGFVNSIFTSNQSRPTIYTDYKSVYADSNVDVVYIGTPHVFHKESCLAAIAAGKHVLCEKPMAINEREVNEMIAAAKEKGVFLMEAVWTRFFPLVLELQRLLHKEKVIGDISRMFCDFGLDINVASLPSTHRLRNLELGGGALLDLGVYPLMFSSVVLDEHVGFRASDPEVTSSLLVVDGVDYDDVIVLKYPENGRMAVLTASMRGKSGENFLRIEGTGGTIVVSGPAASVPKMITISAKGEEEKVLDFEHEGMGFYFEADAVAADILAGRKEDGIMPLAESVRIIRIMDEVRKVGGVVYSQDSV
ncbi:NAD(P)-binding protein [Cadophora sp. DSE1049]|nr:NAD(P)-binding protein [Cadophora sp. DSE1049]